jgi:site-specific DNA-cytosine methylase
VNVLSLFDGISCGMIALERAGARVDNYFSSEIDKYAITVSKANYPSVIQLGDVSKWKEWELPKIDLLIGGSPCQGFSNAGTGQNFQDPRSKLFFLYVDILNHIKKNNNEIFFLFENVKMKKEWVNIISSNLGVEPVLINSALVSAQNRERLYWSNIPYITQPKDRKVVLADIVGVSVQNRTGAMVITKNIYPRKGQNGNVYSLSGKSKTLSAGVGIKGRGIGSSNAPKVEWSNDMGWRRLTTGECEKLQNIPIDYTKSVSETQRYKLLGNGWTVDVITHILEGILSSSFPVKQETSV